MTSVFAFAASASISFANQPFFPNFGFDFDSRVSSSAVGDLNGDGVADVVVANWSFGEVSVLIRDDDTEVVSQQDFDVLGQPVIVRVGDFDRDGILDIMSASPWSDAVSVLIGNGDGSFANRQDYSVGEEPYSLAIGDIDNDGILDLVTANRDSDSVSIRFGSADGTFPTRQDLSVDVFPTWVEIADLNHDGSLDLVLAHGLSLSVLLGNGDGTFDTPISSTTGDNPYTVAIGDLNGDSHPDLVAGNRLSDTVSILLGNGDGTFGSAEHLSVGEFPVSISLDDLNGDSLSDIVVVNPGMTGSETVANISVLLGNGDGSYGPRQNYSAGSRPQSVAVEDLDGDGVLDLLVSDLGRPSTPADNRLILMPGNGDGTFQGRQQYPTGGQPVVVVSSDLDGDGFADLAVANSANYSDNGLSVSIFYNRGNGTFSIGPALDAGGTARSVAAGDLNGDGVKDLVAANSGAATAAVFIGKGDGTFLPREDYPVSDNGIPESLIVGDFNEDEIPDLALANRQGDSVSILLGTGTGTFGASQEFAVADEPRSLAAADFDKDGHLDLVVVNGNSDSISVLFGDGNGEFPLREDHAVGDRPNFVAVGDLDADGAIDIAIANLFSAFNSVTLLFGDGSGDLPVRKDIPSNASNNLSIADVDGDGVLDLIVAQPRVNNSIPDAVTIIRGMGGRNFEVSQTVRVGSGPIVWSNDFDMDGSPDLAVANAGTDSLEVLLNLSDTPARCPADVTGDGSVNLADLNLVLANFGSSTPDGDTNDDGVVDLADLNSVLSAFGTACP